MVRFVRQAVVVSIVATFAFLVSPGAAGARKPPQSYVALGDSYTAGPLIPLQENDPLGCLRSDHNYPHLVAAALAVPTFRDPSCSGAETGDMTNAQNVDPGPNPPRSPKARIFVVAYLAILPESGPGYWPQLPMTPEDVPYLRGVEKKLNAMLAQQAAANRATFVDAYTASIGHDACQLPGTRWVEPVIPASPAAPVHPNLFGMQGYAAAVQLQSTDKSDAHALRCLSLHLSSQTLVLSPQIVARS